MRIALLIPGTGHFLCGSCLRDHSLGRALIARGHDVSVVPLYLPHVVEGDDGLRAALPPPQVRMGGINMYLQQQSPRVFRRLPAFVRRWLDHPGLLKWASRRGGMTGAATLGAMTVSMIRGEEGRQAAEVEGLVASMCAGPAPDLVVLSNAMLIGVARRLRDALDRPVVVTLQGEQPFLDALTEPYRSQAWEELRRRAADVEAFVPVSETYAALMRDRLGLAEDRTAVVRNGIDLTGFPDPPLPIARRPGPPTVGFLARLCEDKGLPLLVESFVALCERGRVPDVRLCAVGVALAEDRPLLARLRDRLERAGLGGRFEFHVDVSRARKLELLAGMHALCVPALYGESFGLYLLEALAAGVPLVQPRAGAFAEVLGETGGGIVTEPDAGAIADGLEAVLLDVGRADEMAGCGRAAVVERFTAGHMAEAFEQVAERVASARPKA